MSERWSQHYKIKFVPPRYHVISSMYFALQFFDHPVIIDFLKDSWLVDVSPYDDISRRELFFLSVCCLLDVFIFPLIFLLTLVVGNIIYSIGFHKDSLS